MESKRYLKNNEYSCYRTGNKVKCWYDDGWELLPDGNHEFTTEQEAIEWCEHNYG